MCPSHSRRSSHFIDRMKEAGIERQAVQVAQVGRAKPLGAPPSPNTPARPQPHQRAGPGRQELSGAHASDPQVAPSRLGARLWALRSAGQNRSERGAEAQPRLVDLAQAAATAAAGAGEGGGGGGAGGAARSRSCHPRPQRPSAPPALESALRPRSACCSGASPARPA